MEPNTADFSFQLFVADVAANSSHAIANLKLLCRTYLPQHHAIEVIDVFKNPERALAEGILMTPTLIKCLPEPACRIVGTLSETGILLEALGLEDIRP